ncbi:MAG: ATP-dependent zinc metalloprotease FtsH [Paludibacteraceae bacterium]|nr:ATP-dependent zinc metalloprotease FtsH [Paludibacteraceae bacterium]MBP5526791.1 ATP-dependent zinc metalloprotease FtsH [Paludibacteraceae bacterium]MBR6110828.1 ATP-dependent zinc metalloprotease FtsH [Paludibacteraceae bacterium]
MAQESNNKPKMPNFKSSSGLYWLYGLVAIFLVGIYFSDDNHSAKEIGYNEIKYLVETNSVSKITVITNDKYAEATVKEGKMRNAFGSDSIKYAANPKVHVKIPSADRFTEDLTEWQKADGVEKVDLTFSEDSSMFEGFLYTFGPFILLIFFWMFIMQRMGGGGAGPGGVFNVGKSKAQLFDKGNNPNKVTFKDVAGLSEAKQEVEEIVEFLKNPARYTELGGKIPKGAILVGPPGTGKTLLAKAVAGEADVPFFSLSGSDFVEMFVGVGASRVRDLFRQAKEKAPCIIFIDEIDAIGRARGKNASMGGGNDERESTLNQLLTEMDGFGTNSGVILLAATNRVDILDKALVRAGRFDRQIHVDLPDVHDRKAIFNVHLSKLKLADDIDVDFLSRQTPGFSGADIANVCNEAALIAARRNKTRVDKEDFLSAVDRIIGGLEKKNKIFTRDEKWAVAVHEAGHATISWMLQYADPLVKVTIVPRGMALGAAWYLPEERQLITKENLLDKMCSLLGGRAAEELVLGTIGTGAVNDLERSTKQAYAMVAYYGMSDKLTNLCYYDSQADYSFTKPYSEETAKVIDDEVKALINNQYERAKQVLRENAEGHRKLAEILFEREVIFADDVEKIFGKRKWESRSDELMRENESGKEEKIEESSVADENHEENKEIPEVDVDKPKEN